MKLQLSTLLGVMLLLALLPVYPTSTLVNPPATAITSSVSAYPVQVPGTGTYSEDFTTTTYLDGGNTTAAGWGTGTLTNTRDFVLIPLGFIPTLGPCWDIEIQGHTLYASNNNPGPATSFEIFNITDPMMINQLSVQPGWPFQSTVAVSGDWAMMASLQLGSGVGFYNTTDLRNPVVGGFVGAFTGSVTDLEIQGHFCYVAVNNSAMSQAFQIIDIENPAAPRLLPVGYLSVNCQGLAIDGQIAYLAEGPLGLSLLNISNPYAAVPIATVPLPAPTIMDVLVDGDLAYVAAGPAGVFVVNCSGPPVLIGACSTGGIAKHLALQSNTLFVADGPLGVSVIDVADPTHPTLIMQIPPMAPVNDVALYAGDLVMATLVGIEIWRFAGEPTGVVGLQPIAAWGLPWELLDIRVEAGIGYVASPNGFHSFDLRHPHAFHTLDVYPAPGRFYRNLDVQGNYAYVADYGAGGGLHVFNVADPSNIYLVSTYPLNFATDVFVDGEVVYVCNGNNVEVLNASSPFGLTLITSIPGLTNATSCWVQGTTLYVTTSVAWWFINITTIAAPNILAGWMLGGSHYDMYVEGDVAYFGDLTGAAYVLNVTDPKTPGIAGIFGSPAYHCWGFGPYMLTANGTAGVGLVDATNINALSSLPGYSHPASMESVVVSGDYVYACGDTTLLILQIFEGAGSNFFTGTYSATSLTVASTTQLIENATVHSVDSWVPAGTSIGFELSADGGLHWEQVTAGIKHTFLYPGTDLRWRANITSPYRDVSPHLYELSIDYEYNDVPSTPSLTDPGATDNDGAFTVTWSASTDDGYIHHYVLQMSDSASFTTILDSWTPTVTNSPLTGLSNGTYYFRVCAVDDDSVSSPWSNTESIIVAILPTTPTPPPIPGFPVLAIAIGVIIGLGGSIILRRRKHSK